MEAKEKNKYKMYFIQDCHGKGKQYYADIIPINGDVEMNEHFQRPEPIIGLINAPPAKAVTLGVTLVTVLIFTLINLIFKHRIRCTTFILLAGIYAALGHITSLIFIMAITTALDEFIAVPLYHKFKNLYTINKEIDKRS